MKQYVPSFSRSIVAFVLLAGLLLPLGACSDLPAAGKSSSAPASAVATQTPTPTPSPTPEPTPTPTPEPTPTPVPTPPPVDGLESSSGAFPHIVREGTALFYIDGSTKNSKIGCVLYRMGLDGTKRTPLLTDVQGLKLFQKLKKSAVAFGQQNILYLKDKRIFFLCMTVELHDKKNKNTAYILSVDLSMKNMKIEKQLMKPDDQKKFWDWYMDNSAVDRSNAVMLTGFRPPVGQDGWNYYTNAGKQICKARPDGSEETIVYSAAAVDRLAVQGEWIYFEKRQIPGIYRVSVNGGEESMIGSCNNMDHVFSGFAVLGDWIYFNEQDSKTNEYSLRKLRIDGLEILPISTKYSPYSFQIINNRIFYNTTDSAKAKGSGALRVMDLDGANDRPVK